MYKHAPNADLSGGSTLTFYELHAQGARSIRSRLEGFTHLHTSGRTGESRPPGAQHSSRGGGGGVVDIRRFHTQLEDD